MSPGSGPDRRREKRFPKHLSLQLSDDRREAIFEPIMIDVSLSGLCFETAKPPAVGSAVSFRIHIPKHGYVAGIGKMQWTYAGKDGRFLCGIRFETFGWANQQTLKNYLFPHVSKRKPLEDLD
jgi:hypothetical protein